MTIRTRLTLIYSALLAVVIVIFGLSLFSLLNWAWHTQLQESMRFVAQQVIDVIRLNELTDAESQPAIRKRLARMPHFAFAVQVWRHDGTLIFNTENLEYSVPFDAENRSSRVEVTRNIYLPAERTHALVSTLPIYTADNRYLGTVQILSPLTTLEAATDRLLRVMLGVGLAALLLSFMIGSVVAGQVLQPLEMINQTAKQITDANDLSRRIPYEGPADELGQLIMTFNTTLERLERSFKTQRRFVADVSHELRTPLTTLQGNLDLIKRFGINAASLEAIESELKRMTRLVGDLLLLAQADSGSLPLEEKEVDLDTLVIEVYKQAKVLTETVKVRLEPPEAVRVKGDADRLKQVLLNLVTNAIKYTPDGGEVTLSLTTEGSYAFIRVTDTGIGIPKEDLPYIFDRFYRVDKARERKIGGAGLGLSIAKWIVEAHHGRIWAESELGKGSTFTVQLPRMDTGSVPESMRDTRPSIRIPLIKRKT
ncbi:MAG: ATP-binding protein [Anaerolineae bacterium]|nr:ATP-binding protein [Anaerolineae bacterium]MDW8299882.1 ATP-binding protein [Anaerolineae bacterium]